MKFIFFILFFTAKIHASSLPQFVLNKSLNQRCHSYFSQNLEECFEANAQLIQTLDFDLKVLDSTNKIYDFISFKNLTITKFSDKGTQSYLRHLKIILDQVLTNNYQNFNLWNFTLQYFSEDDALSILTSLFQDTSDAMTHINYLNKYHTNASSLFLENLKNLESVIRQIHLLQSYRTKDIPDLIFPTQSKKVLSSTLYHFYVPLYLAKSLQDKFSNHIAGNIPVIFIAVYEMVSHENRIEYLIYDPLYFRSVNGIKDIYSAYLARQIFENNHHSLDFQEFKKFFDEHSTEEALLRIIQ